MLQRPSCIGSRNLVGKLPWRIGRRKGSSEKCFKCSKRTSHRRRESRRRWNGETENIVRQRLSSGVSDLRLSRRIARMVCPYDPAGTVEFFRQYYGPTQRAFASLAPDARAALRHDLVRLQTQHNVSAKPNETDTPAEYVEIHARRV